MRIKLLSLFLVAILAACGGGWDGFECDGSVGVYYDHNGDPSSAVNDHPKCGPR